MKVGAIIGFVWPENDARQPKRNAGKLKSNCHAANVLVIAFSQFSCRLSSRGRVNQITATHVPQNMQQFEAAWPGKMEKRKKENPSRTFFRGWFRAVGGKRGEKEIAVHNSGHFPGTLRGARGVACLLHASLRRNNGLHMWRLKLCHPTVGDVNPCERQNVTISFT